MNEPEKIPALVAIFLSLGAADDELANSIQRFRYTSLPDDPAELALACRYALHLTRQAKGRPSNYPIAGLPWGG